MPLIVIEKMSICGSDEQVIEKPLLAINNYDSDTNEYALILNPDI